MTKKETDDIILRDKGCFDIHCDRCYYDELISCDDECTTGYQGPDGNDRRIYKKILKEQKIKKISEILK